jgi:hypothetical protein
MRRLERNCPALLPRCGATDSEEPNMDLTTILIIVLVIVLLGGGGWYGRGRWY